MEIKNKKQAQEYLEELDERDKIFWVTQLNYILKQATKHIVDWDLPIKLNIEVLEGHKDTEKYKKLLQ